MLKHLIVLTCLLSGLQLAMGQCEKCATAEAFSPELCYVAEVFTGKCAAFSSTQNHFYYTRREGAKAEKIELPAAHGTAWLLALAGRHAPKIEAADALFLREALAAWDARRSELRIAAIGAQLYTEADLAALQFETLPSGLGIKVLEQGDGPMPVVGKPVKVHYRGYLTNGNVFDASYNRGQAFSFTLGVGQVIRGWDEGVARLPVGTRALLKLPPALGYGDRAAGSIPPGSTLIFDVLVLDNK